MNEIRFIDLFSGIGGFRLGLERTNQSIGETQQVLSRPDLRHKGNSPLLSSGNQGLSKTLHKNFSFRCVWSCDFNKYANQVYTKHFGEEGHYTGDIRGVDPADIPDFDLLCAGFPCQAFSVAGKRKGFKDTRGTLFFEICRIAEAKRPSLLLLENVKGLLNHDRGRTFTVILQALDELGYWVEWQVLNSQHIGVPQRRERVFIIGHLIGSKRSGREIFPIGEIHKNSSKRTQIKQRRQIGATLSGRSAGGQNARGNYVMTLRDKSTAIDSNYWKGPDQHDQRTIVVDFFNKSVREDTVFNTLKTSQGSAASSAAIIENMRLRRLTPIECERLQGFPDGWTEGVSNTQRYKCLGNAVTVNVIEFLGRKLRSSLSTVNP